MDFNKLRKGITCCIISILFFGYININADTVSEAQLDHLKTVLSYKLIEQITWQNQKDIDTYLIGVYGEDREILQSFESIARGRKLNRSRLRVEYLRSVEDIDQVNVLFVCSDKVSEIYQIYSRIKNKNILLITDECIDYKYIMLNFYQKEANEISFNVNKANLVIEGFQFSPKLLLLGGTEVDVRELYQKMQEDLVLEREKVLEQRKILASMQKNSLEMREKIIRLDTEIKELDSDISMQKQLIEEQKNNIEKQEDNIKKQKLSINEKERQLISLVDTLSDKTEELKSKQDRISEQADVISKQKNDIQDGNSNLEELKEKLLNINTVFQNKQKDIDDAQDNIRKLQLDIESQEKKSRELSRVLSEKEQKIIENEGTISIQSQKLSNQQTVLFLASSLLFLALALVFSIWRANRIKTQLNEELEKKVEERTKDLEDSNTLLKKEIIEKQNAQTREKAHQEKAYESSKLAFLGTLVAGVGHEINNPNEVIMLNAPLLKEVWHKSQNLLDKANKENPLEFLNQPYDEVKDELSHMYDDIADCSARIKNIVRDLKDYAKPSSPEQTYQESIGDIVNVSIGLMKNSIHQSTNNFSCELDEKSPLVMCQKQQIEQVLINLIQNSCQSLTSKSQAVKVSTKVIEDDKKVVVTVEDEGCGIKKEHLKQLTDPFFTTKREFDGMGLGLAITSRIVENHEGTLVYESEEGKGTKAKLTLNCEIP